MPQLIKSKLSPSMVVALIALFVALGGTAWSVAANSIGSKQLRDGQVKSRDVQNNGLKGKDIKAGALTSGKFFQNTTVSLDLPNIPMDFCTAIEPGPAFFGAVQATDEVIVTPPTNKPVEITIVASTGPVRIDACNPTGGTVDPPPGDYEFTIIR
jgi:hypothetical protein